MGRRSIGDRFRDPGFARRGLVCTAKIALLSVLTAPFGIGAFIAAIAFPGSIIVAIVFSLVCPQVRGAGSLATLAGLVGGAICGYYLYGAVCETGEPLVDLAGAIAATVLLGALAAWGALWAYVSGT